MYHRQQLCASSIFDFPLSGTDRADSLSPRSVIVTEGQIASVLATRALVRGGRLRDDQLFQTAEQHRAKPYLGEGGGDLLLETLDQFAVGGDQTLLAFDLSL